MPSTSTKRTIVTMAYEEAGLAGYEFDTTPGEQFAALRRLDAQMAEWAAQGISLGYNFPAVFGAGGLDDPTGIPDGAVSVAALQLALRTFPMFGKQCSGETRYALARGLNALRAMAAVVPTMNLPRGTPTGTGNRYAIGSYPIIIDDGTPANPTLGALTLLSNAGAAISFTTTILGNTVGSSLALLSNIGGFYTLTGAADVWTLHRAALPKGASTETPIVTETLAGAFNSPLTTSLPIALS